MRPFKGVYGLKGEWTLPPGKAYLLSLPLALEIPALRDHSLYVHKSVTKKDKWTVTESETGFRFTGGATRKAAMQAAHNLLLRVGNSGFLAAIARAMDQRAKIAKQK